MTWPASIPYDLRRAWERLEGQRARTTDADRWTEVRDWLIAHGIEPPDHPLPTRDPDAEDRPIY